MIRYICVCGQVYELGDDAIGRRARCKCGRVGIVRSQWVFPGENREPLPPAAEVPRPVAGGSASRGNAEKRASLRRIARTILGAAVGIYIVVGIILFPPLSSDAFEPFQTLKGLAWPFFVFRDTGEARQPTGHFGQDLRRELGRKDITHELETALREEAPWLSDEALAVYVPAYLEHLQRQNKEPGFQELLAWRTAVLSKGRERLSSEARAEWDAIRGRLSATLTREETEFLSRTLKTRGTLSGEDRKRVRTLGLDSFRRLPASDQARMRQIYTDIVRLGIAAQQGE